MFQTNYSKKIQVISFIYFFIKAQLFYLTKHCKTYSETM